MSDGGRWLYGSLLTWPDGDVYILHDVNYTTSGTLNKDPVLPDTVGQFTGLTDKNGKEIYEGDVIESNSTRHVVKYMEKGALFAGVSTSIKDSMTGDYAEIPLWQHWIDGWGKEVIGNIHDNPELLKQITNQTN